MDAFLQSSADADATIIEDAASGQEEDADSDYEASKPKTKKASKAAIAAQERLALSVNFVQTHFPMLRPESDPQDVLDAIAKMSRRPETIFGRNRSVMRDDKEEILQYMEGVRTCVRWLTMKSLSSAMDALHVMQAKVKTTSSSGTQTDAAPEPETRPDTLASKTLVHPDVADFKVCVQEELQKFKEEFIASASTARTYASVVQTTDAPKIKTPVSRPALVLESTDATQKSHKAVLDAWRTKVKFYDKEFAPVRVQTVSNDKVRVEFDTDAQRDETLEMLKDVPALRASESKRRRPLVILKGIANDTDVPDDVSILRTQNPLLRRVVKSDDDIKFRFVRRNKNEALHNVVLEVTPEVRTQMLLIERLNVGHQRVRVQDYSPFVQCFKCLQFGHVQQRCTSDVQRCSHCASGHNITSCPFVLDASKRKCYNCTTHNKKTRRSVNDAHCATSAKDCPRIQTMIERIASRTDYGCH